MCRGVLGGMKDQSDNFNVPIDEELPASWVIPVSGRPLATGQTFGPQEEPLPADGVPLHDDAVCMICFDGTITEVKLYYKVT